MYENEWIPVGHAPVFHETAKVHNPFAVQVMKAGATVETPKAESSQTITTNTMALHSLHINLYMDFYNVYF